MSWLRGDESAVTTLHGPETEHDAGPPAPPPLLPPSAPAGIAPWRKLVIAAILLALAVGLVWQWTSSDDRGGGATTPTPVTTAVTASPSTDPSKPPELRNTGEDFDTIVRSVQAFADWVHQYDPDPKWVPFFVDPRNTDEYGFEWAKKKLAGYQAAGHRYDRPGVKILKVILRERVSADHVGIYVVYEAVTANIVDRDGKVVETQPTFPPTGYFEDWMRGENGRWLPVHSVVLGPPAPEVLK